MGERNVDDIAEALDPDETTTVEGLDLFGVDTTPARLGPSGVVFEDEVLRAGGEIAGDGEIAEIADDQPAGGSPGSMVPRAASSQPPLRADWGRNSQVA